MGLAFCGAESKQAWEKNLVERWFAALTTKWMKRGMHRSVKELVASIHTWIANWNNDPKPFVWHKTGDGIVQSLAPTASESTTRLTSRHLVTGI